MATLWILMCLFGTVFGQCYVDRLAVQENFDTNEFAGRWYEVSWVQYYFEEPYENYLDFTQNYTVVNSSFITAVNSGRSLRDDRTCNIHYANFTVSPDNPAKWSTTIQKKGGTEYHIDHWIITTDYKNYAFVYGCTNRNNQNGQCLNAHAWKWSRSQVMSPEHLRIVNHAVDDVCMTGYSFVDSDQLVQCELTEIGPGDTADGAFMTGSGALVLLCGLLLQLFK